MGSRLLEVTDIHSKGTDPRRRFRATLRWVARLVLISIVGSWLFLYIDSVYQRRRAESLFAELRSLDFATAGFAEVRDITVRYGGHGTQPELLPRFPDFGDPMVDDHGNVTFPWRPRPWPMCTPRDCTFRLWIMTRLPRIPLLDRTATFFYTTLPYLGVRSWVVYAQLEVRSGKLDRSATGVGEYRMERFDNGHRHLVPRGYEVATRRDASSFEYGPCSGQDYQVYVSHGGVKFPAKTLATCVVQSARVSVKRAFDVHFRCLNSLFRSCRFDKLAPSAWADYSAKVGTGTGDPHNKP